MHEFSIAKNILDITVQQLNGQKEQVVSEIELDIGENTGIEIESLQTAMSMIFQNTILKTANIKINNIEGLACCSSCETHFRMNDFLVICPTCGSSNVVIISGKELKVKSLVVENNTG